MNSRTFPSSSASVSAARRYAVSAIGEVSAPVVEAVALAVSELATNCVRHAGTAFTVSVERSPGRLRVDVADSADGVPAVRSPSPSEPSGRGLHVLGRLADRWGVNSTEGEPGKSVWFEIRVSERHDSVVS